MAILLYYNMSNFIPCRNCAKLEGPFPGYYYIKVGVRKAAYVKECDCHRAWSEKQNLLRRLKEANVWTDLSYDPDVDYKGTDSLEDVSALKTYVALFEKKYSDKMIYMFGNNGTQKTTLAMWVARELIKKSHTVLYTLMETLSVSLSPDFKAEDNSRELFVQKALDVDLLIIDEGFDKSKMTVYKSGYQIPFLDSFLRERFDIGKKAVVFISNKTIDSLSSSGFGDSLQSLVARNTNQSSLIFNDVYIKKANSIDSKGLFR